MILIGIAGKKRTGKSTCANYLVHDFQFGQYAFATPLKEMLLAMGLQHDELEEHKEEPLHRLGISLRPRDLLQRLGTEWGRQLIDPDLWTKLADRHIKDCIAGDPDMDRWVISDVRFENEAAWVRSNGGIVVHLVRHTGNVDKHASEAGVEVRPQDYVITNNGTLSQLLEQMCELGKSLTRKGESYAAQ
jgi:hypothetical protein